MRVLELFAGTHSVGKVCEELGYEVVSLDLKGADINIDILEWDYKKDYKPGDFSAIWSSPPCETFSNCRRCWIGRKIKAFGDEVVTAKMLDDDMEQNGLPILRKTEEIINYFKPDRWIIENPSTGKMKNYLQHLPYYDIDYCRYSDYGYKKPTRFWTNKEDFNALKCNGNCGNMVGNKHKTRLDHTPGLNMRYRVPPKLIKELLI
tara:strand:+ start:6 stop:620 length:615 start_codon:yes stop_codon:yes gene_type:complete